ncbi:hypothetical protein [Streptomyces sp. NPDC004728]|uniref:hypothetical protein n=1 Tax=Streptomyces sp. NPDC004728 TaxID=3154289 RepID=UPI0033AB4D02
MTRSFHEIESPFEPRRSSLARFTASTFLCCACDLKVQGEELQELGYLGQKTMLEKNLRNFLGSEPMVPQIYKADREPDEDLLTGR